MRDRIARTLLWVLSILAPRGPGRHSAAFLAGQAGPPEPTAVPGAEHEPESGPEPVVSPWSRPWPTPTPEHVRALYMPLRGEDVALTRPYVLAETTLDLGVILERRRAAEFAAMGVDYPYTYPGAPFPRSAFVAPGVPA